MIVQGDCLEVMRTYPDNHFSAIVTDPPYGLHFMGKDWDKFKRSNFDESPGKHDALSIDGYVRKVRSITCANTSSGTYDDRRNDEFEDFMYQFGKEALRICKPGAFILMCGSPRRFHRQACGLEDAGWEIKDCVMWITGQGFPKSLNISKAIDKQGGSTFYWFGEWLRKEREARKISQHEVARLFLSASGGITGCVSNWELGYNLPTVEQYNKICDFLGIEFEKRKECEREIIAKGFSGTTAIFQSEGGMGKFNVTSSSSDLAKQFDGFGTALKPSHEPIIMAMKPCEGTFAQNAEKWGQAGINIDECRIGEDEISAHGGGINVNRRYGMGKGIPAIPAGSNLHKGRWPANLILGEEAAAMLDQQSGMNASRFFYCAKASSAERNRGDAKNLHPCVKPIRLMEYLIKLIAPPKDALILDPFAGSGTTLIACKNLGVDCVGIEKSADYCEIAKARLSA